MYTILYVVLNYKVVPQVFSVHTFLTSVGCFTSAKIVNTTQYMVNADVTARAASHSLRFSLHAAMKVTVPAVIMMSSTNMKTIEIYRPAVNRMLMVVKHAGCNDCFKVITFS